MTASRTIRTRAGGPVVHYAPGQLTWRGRLRLEWRALRALPDRIHAMPGHLTDSTGTCLYAVVVERSRWVVRPSLGWRSYRLLARPVSTASWIPLGDEAAALAWATRVVVHTA